MILICSFLDSLQVNHIYVVYNIKVIYVISELFNYNKLESYAKDLFKNKQNINNAVILKIDLKTRGSYIEGNKATMYRFFDDPKG